MKWPLEREVAHKLAQMRGWLEQRHAGAVRLRGADWFAWATAGASNAQNPMSPCGGAELLVTRDGAYILTDEAEAPRLRDEEVRGPWTWQVSPWMQAQRNELREHFVQHAASGALVLSDLPRLHERGLLNSMCEERLVLLEPEQRRYRQVGQLAASAASAALRLARPDWTEQELAAACIRALWLRGLQAVHVMAMGADRHPRYRRAPASTAILGARAVLAVCARRYGLCASLSRQVCFGHAGPQPGSPVLKDVAKEAIERAIEADAYTDPNKHARRPAGEELNRQARENANAADGLGRGAAGVVTGGLTGQFTSGLASQFLSQFASGANDDAAAVSAGNDNSVEHNDATLLALETVALDACAAGNALSMVYHALDSAYAYAGHPDTVLRHCQGGIHGYLAPEVMASAHTEIILKHGMAVALHPSLPCGMVEDTFLLDGGQLRNLTYDPAWPSTLIQGRRRPLTLVPG